MRSAALEELDRGPERHRQEHGDEEHLDDRPDLVDQVQDHKVATATRMTFATARVLGTTAGRLKPAPDAAG